MHTGFNIILLQYKTREMKIIPQMERYIKLSSSVYIVSVSNGL